MTIESSRMESNGSKLPTKDSMELDSMKMDESWIELLGIVEFFSNLGENQLLLRLSFPFPPLLFSSLLFPSLCLEIEISIGFEITMSNPEVVKLNWFDSIEKHLIPILTFSFSLPVPLPLLSFFFPFVFDLIPVV